MTKKYNIKYPYYGLSTGKVPFVIISENNAVCLEHAGTYGFGLANYISRVKILKLFKFSKPISKEDFTKFLQRDLNKFLCSLPGTEILTAPKTLAISCNEKNEKGEIKQW